MKIGEAYNVLINAEKKAKFDQELNNFIFKCRNGFNA
jgi:DnaJ-class molecular chaperone